MEERTERPIIFAIITLFLTFVVVYMAFFRSQPSDSTSDTGQFTGNSETMSGQQIDTGMNILMSGSTLLSGSLTTGSDQDGWVALNPNPPVGDKKDTGSTSTVVPVSSPSLSLSSLQTLREKVSTLSGVSLWYNSIKMAETLALDTKFAFTDTDNILYGYLGTGSVETSNEIIKRLGGNSIEIETENDISKNLLRGDRVVFVNIPGITFVRKGTTEQKLLVTMVIDIGEDKRLIQSPFDRYYSSKKRMKTLFESLYSKIL